jgi:2-keto-4-pentenoate hydratase/2-oxohepta-3-ene-1,7-dioic acid hydratase in catechol pathway
MRLAMIADQEGAALAVIKNDQAAILPSSEFRDLTSVILGGREALKAIARVAESLPASAWRPLANVAFRLPVERPGKVICLGLNYVDHAKEGGYQVPEYPALFMRCTTSLIPANAPMVRPRVSEKLDYEAELMVVIGRRGRHVSEEDALDLVFGYTCFNDASVRDYQRKTHQWTPGKNFDGTGAVGPIVATPDELPPGASGLKIICRLAGQTVQSANTSDMIISVAKTLSLLSEFTTLEPGDLVALGTPQGVGHARTPPLWMRPGDTVEVEIEGIGVLANKIVDEDFNGKAAAA